MSDLSAADIAEGQLLYQSMIDVPSNESYARLLDWAAPRWAALLDAAEKAARLETQLAAIKAADPDLFDPRGGYSRGAAYETYGSAGHHLREEYLAAIGLTPEEDADDE